MKRILIVIAVIIGSTGTNDASAQNRHSLRDENKRIHHGVANGHLTRTETARLHAQKVQLRREAVRYKTNDGRISGRERADLRRDNRQLNRNIYRQKHDRQRRF